MISKLDRACTVALVGSALVLAWQVLTVEFNFGGNWTGLFCTGAARPVPPALERGTVRSANASGYDGQMYRYIAHDPFFSKGYRQYVDDPRLRYRRILVPGAAWLLGLGAEGAIDSMYSMVVLVSVLFGVYWSARLFERDGRSAWLGLLFLLVPATLTSADRLLIDATILACFAGFVYYVRCERLGAALLVASLALFTRETGAFLLLPLCWSRQWWRGALVFAAYAGWSAFVWMHTAPSQAAQQVFSWPLIGHLQRLVTPREVPLAWQRPILQTTDALAMLGLLASLALALWLLRSEPSREIRLCVALFVALAMVLSSPSQLEDPFGWSRPISPVFLYVIYRSRKLLWMLAPALVTLGVAVYFANPLIGILTRMIPGTK